MSVWLSIGLEPNLQWSFEGPFDVLFILCVYQVFFPTICNRVSKQRHHFLLSDSKIKTP